MIKLELEINEVNMILAVLGKHPFEEVVKLISKLNSKVIHRLKHLLRLLNYQLPK